MTHRPAPPTVPAPLPLARVAITGASGLLGTAMTRDLTAGGAEVIPVVRGTRRPGVRWDPAGGWLDAAGLEGVDAVLHFAGEPIDGGRWSESRKRRIRDSRVKGTRLLSAGLAGLSRPPRVLVASSAVGIYGDRGDAILTETDPAGGGFLAEVGVEWEAATSAASAAGIRVVHLRLGVVLDPTGGMLRRILPIFRLGLGGRLGSGRQWLSWIAMPDLLRVIRFVMDTPSLAGPVNTVSPEPVRNEELTQALGRVLRRPTPFPVPGALLRLAVGGLADEALLASTRVAPSRLEDAGFEWHHRAVEPTLRALLA